MESRPVGPGDDVDSWCTRCRMNLNHRVIAVVGNDIKRVQCLTCGSEHKYHPPRSDGSEPSSKKSIRVSAARKDRNGGAKARAGAEGEWNTVMNNMPPGTEPKRYSIYDSYSAKEYIEHPNFGVGRVLEVLGRDRVEVIFKEGRKTLICNKNRA